MKLFDLKILEGKFQDISDISKLDDGGQKYVFKAKHKDYGDVVLKIVPDSISNERVHREIEIASECSINNVPRLYNWGYVNIEDEDLLYIIEEYAEGITLRKYLMANNKLSLKDGLDLMDTLLSIGVELENLEIVHRDIKPENIIVKKQGGFSLLDFGIARCLRKPSLTMTKAHFGPHTPGYAAPEQFRNIKKEIDSRADLFSIGVTVYEAIVGCHPFLKGTEHPLDMLRMTETVTPILVIIPGDTQRQLIGLITIMMDKFPSRRPKNAKTAMSWFRALLPTINIEEE